jgi:O-antigen/teichoic acid export membrane protein
VLGSYAAAQRIISVAVFIPGIIGMPLYPALCRLAQADDQEGFRRLLRRGLRAVMLMIVPITALCIAGAPVIPSLVRWPEEFNQTVPLIVILALQMPLVAVDILLALALAALHREHLWFRVGAAAAVLSTLANLLLIPFFQRTMGNGAIGAAGVTVGAELVILVGSFVVLPRGTVGWSLAAVAARVATAGTACWAATAVLLGPASAVLSPIVALGAASAGGGLAFVATAMLLRLVCPSDVQAMRNAVLGVVGSRLRLRSPFRLAFSR